MQPGADGRRGGLPQRHRAILAALAVQVDAGCTVQHHVDDAHPDDLRDARAGVVEQAQQQVVPLRRPLGAGLPQHGDHLRPSQMTQQRTLESLHRHGHRALDGVQRRHVASTGEFQECPQGREPQVTAAHRVVPLPLQVGQELQDQLRRDVHELHGHWRLAQVPGCIPEEQRHRVAVAGHCSWAERALRDQVLGEELLHQRREAWRGALPVGARLMHG